MTNLNGTTATAAMAQGVESTPADLSPDGHIVVASMIACLLLMAIFTAALTFRTRSRQPLPTPRRVVHKTNLRGWVMDQVVMMTTVSAAMIFSVALALLIEELIFGGLFRLFFGEREPLEAAATVPAKHLRGDVVGRARQSGL
jgi:hypothetical protein